MPFVPVLCAPLHPTARLSFFTPSLRPRDALRRPLRQPFAPLKCISILLCERVYRIAGTPGNIIIVNGFHFLTMPRFPCKFGPMTVLYTVSDGHGEYDMALSLTHAASGRELGQWKSRERLAEPLVVADVTVVLNGVPLPEPGKYLFDLKCNGDLIASRPFFVNAAKMTRASLTDE